MATVPCLPERAESSVAGDREPGYQELKAYLCRLGADRYNHAHSRTLYQHLMATRQILAHWSQPVWMQNAGALHSIYSTDVYKSKLISRSERTSVARIAGNRTERIAYLFCTVPRQNLFDALRLGTPSPMRIAPIVVPTAVPAQAVQLNQDEIDALLIIHMANEAEQSASSDRSPGLWLERLGWLASGLSSAARLPLFLDSDALRISLKQESAARTAYINAIEVWRSGKQEQALQGFCLSSDHCAVWAEPLILRACIALERGERAQAGALSTESRRRLSVLGVAWDKRLTYSQWYWLACVTGALAADPTRLTWCPPLQHRFRILMTALLGKNLDAMRNLLGPDGDRESRVVLPSMTPFTRKAERMSALPPRFLHYLSRFADKETDPKMFHYPSLPSRPFFDAETFPIVVDLQANYQQIREEILALDSGQFHREAEKSIKRTGAWNVFMLYERGRKNEANCELCPTAVRIIERHDTVKTLAGLMYVSRMSPHTTIESHRGPTNMRLRCHLGIQVPPGACGIRVGDQIGRWEEGQCLVFDDYFPHEAWNHTDESRIVLILDIWHPELSRREIQLLEGLHRYVMAQTRSLNIYWSGNDKVRKQHYD